MFGIYETFQNEAKRNRVRVNDPLADLLRPIMRLLRKLESWQWKRDSRVAMRRRRAMNGV